jgi:hypothetical protein
MPMKKFWLSWYHDPAKLGGFELTAPWWVSGTRMSDDADTVVAAVQADHPEGAKDRVLRSYDVPPDDVEWRFCEERPANWTPFCDRFPKADWMHWR